MTHSNRAGIYYRDCKARRRIILSGTPIQNDLDELYAVVAFVAPGLLGKQSPFTMLTMMLTDLCLGTTLVQARWQSSSAASRVPSPVATKRMPLPPTGRPGARRPSNFETC